MPSADYEGSRCQRDPDSGLYFDCAPQPLLGSLATANDTPDLNQIAEACRESHSRVDVDIAGRP